MILFAVIVCLVLFRNLSNVLEWFEVTARLDEFEDYTEILLPVMWGFAIYAFLQGMADKAREELNRSLAAKNKELENVVYIASHDLRAPLMNIRGFSQELSSSCDEICQAGGKGAFEGQEGQEERIKRLIEEEIPESLGFINAAAESMDMVIEGLLRLSRAGTEEIRIERLDMNRLIERVGQAKNYQIQEKGVSFRWERLPVCFGDRKQVSQVFSNLIDNAIKYLEPERKGEIAVFGCVRGDDCVYEVRDNGIGIAEKDWEKVFEIFGRVDADSEVGGEGLGLTIVARMVERQGGSVRVESEVGEGTSFFVTLPRG
jgi:signal transduction histidine kinase